MTAEQAAKACTALIAAHLDPADFPGTWMSYDQHVARLEREFTEIISQVTPTPLSVAAARTLLWREGMDGAYAMRRATENSVRAQVLAEGGDAGYDPADLESAITDSAGLVHRPPPRLFPQEIVEPQPKPWWKRWIG